MDKKVYYQGLDAALKVLLAPAKVNFGLWVKGKNRWLS